jgi:lipoprotein-anchoring transpeptidase ErfK/SrfK
MAHRSLSAGELQSGTEFKRVGKMSNKSRMIARATIIGLMLSAAPMASAVGQPASTIETPVAEPASAQEQASIIIAAAADEARAEQGRMEAEAKEARELEEKAAALKPGAFLWNPDRSPEGEVELVVSIEEQKAYVFRADKLIGVTTVSTGKRGHRTPTGSFTILQKNRRHFSNLYNNAPMPNMQRLTWGGIALHAGALPGYPASHGCVRLPMEFSKILFGVTKMGGRVHIVAGTPKSAADALAFATGRGGTIQMASAR